MKLLRQPLRRRQVRRGLVAEQQHRRRRAGERQAAAQPAPGKVGQGRVDPVLAAARRHLRLRLRVVRLQDHDPRSAGQAVSEPFGLARKPLRLGVVEASGEQLLHQVAAEPALDLRRRLFLGHLESKHGGAVLEGPQPAVRGLIGTGLRNRDHEETEQVGAGADGHDVQLPRRPAGGDADLGRAVLAQQLRRQGQARRKGLALLGTAPDPEPVDRVEAGTALGQGADTVQDGRDPGAIEGELGETLVDLVREADLRQLRLQPALQLHPLQDSGDLPGDRLQEVDVGFDEAALLRALDVEHPDQPVPGLDGDREHRLEALLVDTGDPLEALVEADVRDGQVRAVLRHPARDALAQPEMGAADHLRVQAVGGGQAEPALAHLEQVEGADVDRHRGGRLPDDQLHELPRLLRGGRLLGEPLQATVSRQGRIWIRAVIIKSRPGLRTYLTRI